MTIRKMDRKHFLEEEQDGRPVDMKHRLRLKNAILGVRSEFPGANLC